ncbi:hypothetical protein KCP77_20350 [Salmonella enterica subsp. enterica]|nr:hypothetical protein KCP77_20350 [Salmonella enterica subsp. enterica]
MRYTKLVLYAEHEFTPRRLPAAIAGTGSMSTPRLSALIGALRGPEHGGGE